MRRIVDSISELEQDTFLFKCIKIFDALYMNSELTSTETRYLIQLIKIHRQGLSITSKKANTILRQFFNTQDKDRSIWIYRGKLKSKGWLVQTPESIVLHPALQGKFNSLHWDIKIKHEPKGQN